MQCFIRFQFQSASTQKHNKLIESINKTVNDQRKQELEDKLEKKRQEEEAKRLMKIEKRSEMISPDSLKLLVFTWN